MAETITTVSDKQIQEAYRILKDGLQSNTPEWCKKIAVHLRVVTGAGVLHIYHNDPKHSNEAKFEVYKTCIRALVSKDDSQLSVAPPPEQRIDPVNVSIIPASNEEAKVNMCPTCEGKPGRFVCPTCNDGKPKEAKPKAEPIDVEEVKPRVVNPLVVVGDLVPKPVVAEDPVLKQLAAALSPYLNLPKAADVDETAFNRLLDGSLEGKVKTLMGNGAFPKDRVQAIIDEAMKNIGVRRIDFTIAAGQVRSIEGLMHPQVTQVARWVMADVPVWAWSAAGSGKTHMARQIAAMLGIECYVISVDPTLTVAKLLGYRNVANGEFVPGLLYAAFKDGGLVALDEIDTGDPGVIASINAMLSNGHYLFPNGETVTRHEKFRVLACANTKGTGAVAGYTARNKLDAATLDRFGIIEFKYDEGLELAIATGEGKPGEPWKHGQPATAQRIKAYAEWVIRVRKQVGTSVLISPRATINGCKALRLGIPMQEVIDALVFKLCSEDTINRIKHSCPLPSLL